MIAKTQLKYKAILMRKNGHTYSEILKKIPVAKSTLSLWLREVYLTKRQSHKLTLKKKQSMLKGAAARKTDRIKRVKEIYEKSDKELSNLSKRDLWMLGIALYWAEGSKEKETRPGSSVLFANTDPRMIKVFIKWLSVLFNVSKKDLVCNIAFHKSHIDREKIIIRYWAKIIGVAESKFKKVLIKNHQISTKYPNRHLYFGTLRVKVRASSTIVRRIDGWVKKIDKLI